jgi:ferredoxin
MEKKRSFRIELETPEGCPSFDCAETDHVWDTAAANGIALPAICHQGRCLTFAARLLEGSVEHDHPDAYFEEDKIEGYILLCRAMPRSDLRIRTHQQRQMREERIAHRLPAPYG